MAPFWKVGDHPCLPCKRLRRLKGGKEGALLSSTSTSNSQNTEEPPSHKLNHQNDFIQTEISHNPCPDFRAWENVSDMTVEFIKQRNHGLSLQTLSVNCYRDVNLILCKEIRNLCVPCETCVGFFNFIHFYCCCWMVFAYACMERHEDKFPVCMFMSCGE